MRLALNLIALAGFVLIIAGIAMWSVAVAMIVGGFMLVVFACMVFYEKYGTGHE